MNKNKKNSVLLNKILVQVIPSFRRNNQNQASCREKKKNFLLWGRVPTSVWDPCPTREKKGLIIRRAFYNLIPVTQHAYNAIIGISAINLTQQTFFEKNFYTSYTKLTEIKLITIGLASAERIRRWAEKTLPNGKIIGQVTNANTLHHKTFKPQKGGLFCERIFGPLKDFECACGKIQKPFINLKGVASVSNQISTNIDPLSLFSTNETLRNGSLPLSLPPTSPGGKHAFGFGGFATTLVTTNDQREKGREDLIRSQRENQQSTPSTERDTKALIPLVIPTSYNVLKRQYCPICDVEYTWSVIRRYQLGYIDLISPVTHVWYLKATPSYLSILLDMKKKHLEQIVYGSETITLATGLEFLTLSFAPKMNPYFWKNQTEQKIFKWNHAFFQNQRFLSIKPRREKKSTKHKGLMGPLVKKTSPPSTFAAGPSLWSLGGWRFFRAKHTFGSEFFSLIRTKRQKEELNTKESQAEPPGPKSRRERLLLRVSVGSPFPLAFLKKQGGGVKNWKEGVLWGKGPTKKSNKLNYLKLRLILVSLGITKKQLFDLAYYLKEQAFSSFLSRMGVLLKKKPVLPFGQDQRHTLVGPMPHNTLPISLFSLSSLRTGRTGRAESVPFGLVVSPPNKKRFILQPKTKSQKEYQRLKANQFEIALKSVQSTSFKKTNKIEMQTILKKLPMQFYILSSIEHLTQKKAIVFTFQKAWKILIKKVYKKAFLKAKKIRKAISLNFSVWGIQKLKKREKGAGPFFFFVWGPTRQNFAKKKSTQRHDLVLPFGQDQRQRERGVFSKKKNNTGAFSNFFVLSNFLTLVGRSKAGGNNFSTRWFSYGAPAVLPFGQDQKPKDHNQKLKEESKETYCYAQKQKFFLGKYKFKNDLWSYIVKFLNFNVKNQLWSDSRASTISKEHYIIFNLSLKAIMLSNTTLEIATQLIMERSCIKILKETNIKKSILVKSLTKSILRNNLLMLKIFLPLKLPVLSKKEKVITLINKLHWLPKFFFVCFSFFNFLVKKTKYKYKAVLSKDGLSVRRVGSFLGPHKKKSSQRSVVLWPLVLSSSLWPLVLSSSLWSEPKAKGKNSEPKAKGKDGRGPTRKHREVASPPKGREGRLASLPKNKPKVNSVSLFESFSKEFFPFKNIEKKKRKKNLFHRKKPHLTSKIVNNVYSLSHRYRWATSLDWTLFFEYISAPINFNDKIIPKYKYRLNNFEQSNIANRNPTKSDPLLHRAFLLFNYKNFVDLLDFLKLQKQKLNQLENKHPTLSFLQTFLPLVDLTLEKNSHSLDLVGAVLPFGQDQRHKGPHTKDKGPFVENVEKELSVESRKTAMFGGGLIQKLLMELNFNPQNKTKSKNELNKMDKQNRFLLYELNKQINKLKITIDKQAEPLFCNAPEDQKEPFFIKNQTTKIEKSKQELMKKDFAQPVLSFGQDQKNQENDPKTFNHKASKQIKKQLKELVKQRDFLTRRTKLVRKLFISSKTAGDWSPSSMILSLLPVLPPDLRPIVKMGNSGTNVKIAASDLNRLYQRVLYRNERLKKILKGNRITKPFLIKEGSSTNSIKINSTEIKFTQSLLQEAVDNLIQNNKSGVPAEKDSRGRALKSLSDSLKGKQGRFRQYLLGKRVDYSGRSVIIVGPKLKLHQCGIPKEMALELFLPFLLKRILRYNLAQTVVGAKSLINNNKPLVWELLTEIMQVSPILLNRAPTLHRLGIQAFIPKLVEGRAILLHPLVCSAFNADFDGDQMAVHIPITVESRAEAWKLMLSRNNLLSPATGDPISTPSQDMVLGCYYLTTQSTKRTIKKKRGFGLYFKSQEDVLKAYSQQKIDLHANVWIQWNQLIEDAHELEYPIEIRLTKYGTWKEITRKSHKIFDNTGFLINNYIKTTPGKIYFNDLIKNAINS